MAAVAAVAAVVAAVVYVYSLRLYYSNNDGAVVEYCARAHTRERYACHSMTACVRMLAASMLEY